MWAKLTHYQNHCWCKNTRCSRAALWPGADIQELLSPTPKTTPPSFSHCQLARSHRAFPSLSDPPAGLSAAISNRWGKKKILQNTQTCSGARTYLDQVKPPSGWKTELKVGGYSNNFWEITGSDCTNILHCNLGRWVGDSHQVCLGTGPFWIQFQATKISKVINSQTQTAFGEPSKQKFGLKKKGGSP